MRVVVISSQADYYKVLTRDPSLYCVYGDSFVAVFCSDVSESKVAVFDTPTSLCVIVGHVYSLNVTDHSRPNPAECYTETFSSSPEAFVNHFDGTFMVIDYNKRCSEITIFRDLLGLWHAYYSNTQHGFAVSTSIDDILRFRRPTPTHLSVEAFDLYLTFQYVPQPYTAFREVHQVPYLGCVTYLPGKTTETRFKGSLQELIRRHDANDHPSIRQLLRDSLRIQLAHSSPQVGAFLSGGIDTSCNVALLSGDLGIRPTVFTASFQEASYDESPYARIVAEHFRLEHHEVIITPNDVELLPAIAAICDSPLADRALLPEYVICASAHALGISCMVSGEGGDEVLGYPRNMPQTIDYNSLLHFDDRTLADYYYTLSALMTVESRARFLLHMDRKHNYLAELYGREPDMHQFEKVLYGQWQTWLIDNVLMKDVQLCLNAGLDFVSPFINMNVMKHIAGLSLSDKLVKLRDKSYVKSEFADALPKVILNKPKHKFHVPIAEWLRGDIGEFARDVLFANDSVILNYVDKKLLAEMLEEHECGERDNNRIIWAMMVFTLWYQGKRVLL